MKTQLTGPAADYVRTVNAGDAAALPQLFADGAIVDDNGRQFRGRPEITAWAQREIFAPSVRLEVLGVEDRDGATIVTTEVDGNFDRTGLPDPVVIDHLVVAKDGRIVSLTCRLAGAP